MIKINNFLLVMALFMLVGCNSIDSKKVKPNNNIKKDSKLSQTISEGTILSNKELVPTIDKRILNLLEKTKILDIPLTFSFEQFDISSIEKIIPLSDDVLDLLHIDRIKRFKEEDYSKIVWECSQIELSESYVTLVFAIYDGAIGQHVLINYTNDFKLIDFEFITYEDYIEGYSSIKSLIKKSEIIRCYSGYEQPNDTTILKIDENGFINIVEKELKPITASVEETNEVLHKSLKDFEVLTNIIETEKFKIRIDRLENGSYRYSSWSPNQKMSEKPDLILTKGECFREGTGGNRRFEFRNGIYTYECLIQPLRGAQAPPAALAVYKSNERILYQPAQIVK